MTHDDDQVDGFSMEIGREYPRAIYSPSVARQLVGLVFTHDGADCRIVAAAPSADGRAIEIAARVLPAQERRMSDHPYTDPGDGRTECGPCGNLPVTDAARARAAAAGPWVIYHDSVPAPDPELVRAAGFSSDPCLARSPGGGMECRRPLNHARKLGHYGPDKGGRWHVWEGDSRSGGR